MRAENLEDLWNNWQALFSLLTRQEYRTLRRYNLPQYMFVYKSCEIPLFYPTDKIWLEFNLTITIIGNIAQ